MCRNRNSQEGDSVFLNTRNVLYITTTGGLNHKKKSFPCLDVAMHVSRITSRSVTHRVKCFLGDPHYRHLRRARKNKIDNWTTALIEIRFDCICCSRWNSRHHIGLVRIRSGTFFWFFSNREKCEQPQNASRGRVCGLIFHPFQASQFVTRFSPAENGKL